MHSKLLGQNHNPFGRSHAVMCYYLNWWFIPNQLKVHAPRRDPIHGKNVQRNKSAKNDFGNNSRRNMTDDQKNICIDIWCYLWEGYENCAEYHAWRHLFARQRMHTKTPRNDWFQAMHEIYGSTKRLIIKIDNSKITSSSQMETATIWLIKHALMPHFVVERTIFNSFNNAIKVLRNDRDEDLRVA